MFNHRKLMALSILIIMCLSLMSACEKKQSQSQKSIFLKSSKLDIKDEKTIYTDKLKDITKTAQIAMNDDKPCQTMWIPQKQETTLSEITSWLKQANLYNGVIPNPKNPGDVIFNAYIGPSILYITTSNSHKIAIKPAFYIEKDNRDLYSAHYITNVLEFDYDGQKTYIQSKSLYDWLKNDSWRKEFKKF